MEWPYLPGHREMDKRKGSTYTHSELALRMMIITHLRAWAMLLGFIGSSSPSQVTSNSFSLVSSPTAVIPLSSSLDCDRAGLSISLSLEWRAAFSSTPWSTCVSGLGTTSNGTRVSSFRTAGSDSSRSILLFCVSVGKRKALNREQSGLA